LRVQIFQEEETATPAKNAFIQLCLLRIFDLEYLVEFVIFFA